MPNEKAKRGRWAFPWADCTPIRVWTGCGRLTVRWWWWWWWRWRWRWRWAGWRWVPATAAAADGTTAAFVFPPPLPGARMVMPRSWQVIGVHGGRLGAGVSDMLVVWLLSVGYQWFKGLDTGLKGSGVIVARITVYVWGFAKFTLRQWLVCGWTRRGRWTGVSVSVWLGGITPRSTSSVGGFVLGLGHGD